MKEKTCSTCKNNVSGTRNTAPGKHNPCPDCFEYCNHEKGLKLSRIDIIGQNGGDGEHYEKKHKYILSYDKKSLKQAINYLKPVFPDVDKHDIELFMADCAVAFMTSQKHRFYNKGIYLLFSLDGDNIDVDIAVQPWFGDYKFVEKEIFV